MKGWLVLRKSMRGPKSIQLSCRILYQIILTFPAQLLVHSHPRDSDGWMSSPTPFIFLPYRLPTPCTEHLLGMQCSVRHPQGYREVRTCRCLACGFTEEFVHEDQSILTASTQISLQNGPSTDFAISPQTRRVVWKRSEMP